MCQFSCCTISLRNIDTVLSALMCRASVFERFRDSFRNFDHVHYILHQILTKTVKTANQSTRTTGGFLLKF